MAFSPKIMSLRGLNCEPNRCLPVRQVSTEGHITAIEVDLANEQIRNILKTWVDLY